ncbi:DUF397 domain-containing protein [Streptomyces sp. bgisy100]|uniref:DUF397 domain-containing protein n=1 Tax=Streptomyces sp. bgisy100 TaxID=3413783 RepID=UPI003D71CA3F
MRDELVWFTSSHSSSGGGECVEVAVSWFTSSHSDTGGGNCVEVATCPGTVHVRDSKDKSGPQLAFSPGAWADFVAYAARQPVR